MSAFQRQAEEVRQECIQRRTLVLSRPDLARRLTQPPLGYAQPEQWNGYLPPEHYNGVVNDSPRRAALVDIIAAAQAAERIRDDDLEVF